MSSVPGWLCEIFTSIQGEGLHCGQRQTFVRFADCNLDCKYCDTAASRQPRPASCAIEHLPGCGVFEEVPNPVDAGRVVDACRDLRAQTIAITGGEPLMQVNYLTGLIRQLKAGGFRVYLETNGTLPENLRHVVADCDIICMDIKIPSAADTGDLWEVHSQFLEVAASTEVFVKTVVSRDTSKDEIRRTADVIARQDRRIPLVIQPVTGASPVAGATLMALQDAALQQLDDVRVIPQCHRMLGLS